MIHIQPKIWYPQMFLPQKQAAISFYFIQSFKTLHVYNHSQEWIGFMRQSQHWGGRVGDFAQSTYANVVAEGYAVMEL